MHAPHSSTKRCQNLCQGIRPKGRARGSRSPRRRRPRTQSRRTRAVPAGWRPPPAREGRSRLVGRIARPSACFAQSVVEMQYENQGALPLPKSRGLCLTRHEQTAAGAALRPARPCSSGAGCCTRRPSSTRMRRHHATRPMTIRRWLICPCFLSEQPRPASTPHFCARHRRSTGLTLTSTAWRLARACRHVRYSAPGRSLRSAALRGAPAKTCWFHHGRPSTLPCHLLVCQPGRRPCSGSHHRHQHTHHRRRHRRRRRSSSHRSRLIRRCAHHPRGQARCYTAA